MRKWVGALLLFAIGALQGTAQSTLVFCERGSAYDSLAGEIAGREGIAVARSIGEVAGRSPAFVLWVAAPGELTTAKMVEMGLFLGRRDEPISIGIITGSTIETARALYARKDQARAERAAVVNGRYPRVLETPEILEYETAGSEVAVATALNKNSFIDCLRRCGYVSFAGHGGPTYLKLNDHRDEFSSSEIPDLPPVVIGTISCNVLNNPRESIGVAFIDRGAAAFAGSVFSPIGGMGGLPFKNSWPEFPIGHIVQLQNKSLVQKSARFPYYFLLGDPRICLQAGPACRLISDKIEGDRRAMKFSEAPKGWVPVRIEGGAKYGYAEIAGRVSSTMNPWFANEEMQMFNLGGDKYVLFDHAGGEFSVELRMKAPVLWDARHAVMDGLDGGLIGAYSDASAFIVAIFVLAACGAVVVLRGRRESVGKNVLIRASVAGVAMALLVVATAMMHARSAIGPAAFAGAIVIEFALAGVGFVLFATGRTKMRVFLACFVPVVPLVIGVGIMFAILATMNHGIAGRIGVGVFNYHLVRPIVIGAVAKLVFVGGVFFGVKK